MGVSFIKIFKAKVVWVCFSFMVVAVHISCAQSSAMFSQYRFNELVLNPAYAGTHSITEITALYRNQWSGIEGAPETKTLSAHSLLGQGPSAIGLIILNDKIGITKQNQFSLIYAYRLPIGDGTLSFGIQSQFNFVKFDFSNLNLDVDDDPSFNEDLSENEVNFGAGLYYSTDRFYIGLAATNMDRSKIFSRHWLVSAGKVFDINRNFKIKPSVLVKYVAGAPLEIDLSGTVFWKDKVWLGASWRSFDGVHFLTGFNVTPRLSLGYAYDWILTDLNAFSSGTNEVMLSYRFSFDRSMIITPRYF
ncbi:type IX secretion system membrane protein PorP/SprF [Fulvivirgaceae bacterium BMA10]|uniref:Type IX secretion system membrane protein PorP/SprF n=1 Tax=Splendidivirga corallicola TaxID=3051826 RepID=A0ABT8KHL8_9BACT|nr:type IX secretion system membrane protein PorP/SprF [Fulvivirgaceae bacterium BMA10]